ncbi:ACP S-malonyltransferase [Plantactinospora sp. KLBMP9567]|uniref:ACP S-malonyltransferase n=1 Tax=Plantactinospora sp. KLBMP9567 TaxID=3085900 RepID=UPI002981FF40|nr:ACP S-malonyltransferase [Plantactinospora sp. KLBMP9567]MDW5322300.1 ACP S-malonyltransferase [Plantactinospora sp. KLBMP9567]
MYGLVFPGQGTQRPRMGAELFRRYPEIVAAAEDVLGWSPREMSERGDVAQLTDTRYAQPTIFLVNALRALAHAEDDDPREYAVFAGHSLGEFNALVAAGILDLMSGLRLVRERALAMAEVRDGGMVAVLGLPADEVERVIRRSNLNQVFLANRNSDRHVTLGGQSAQLGLVSRLLRSAGASNVLPLRVSGPFHTPLMAPARVRFARALREASFGPGHTLVVSSVTGADFDPTFAAELLTRQLVSPVEWVAVVHRLRRLGVTQVDELEGSTLTAMIGAVR